MKKSLLAACALVLPASAAVIQFDLEGVGGSGLLATNERPTAVTTGGSGGEILGGVTFDDVTKILLINVGWGSAQGFNDLTGTVSAAHLHGAASQTGTAGVFQPLTIANSSADNGMITTSITLSPEQEAALLSGMTYLNMHTAANPGGEIRGNLVSAIPEPSALALGLLGGLALLRRSRTAAGS